MSGNATTNILLAGIGGQGILLMSSVISRAAILSGARVKSNEVHGMAQRGGTVLAQVRYGKAVYSPLLWEGTADILISLEKSESLRFAHYLKPEGVAVVSDQVIVPVTVSSGQAKYPADADARLLRAFPRLTRIDALGIAEEIGSAKAANLVALGAAADAFPDLGEYWEAAIRTSIPARHLELNLRAFAAGKERKR